MRRAINIIACVVIVFVSCKMDVPNSGICLEKQLIGLTSVHNARQLGGYCIGNKKIKENLLLRSARLSGLSKEDSLTLCDKFRVQCIYDFRGKGESLQAPDVIPGNAKYMSLSLSFTEGSGARDVKFKDESEMIGLLLKNAENPAVQAMCTDIYNKLFFEEESQEVYRQFFAHLVTLQPADGALLWHCTQGKDRAGCASAMLLAALGADRELIMADFTLSKSYYDVLLSQVKTETEAQRAVINTLISANPVIFEAALDRIDEKYGSFTNYLTECIGVTPQMMETLRDRFLE